MRAMGRRGTLGKQHWQVPAAGKATRSCITAEPWRRAGQTPAPSICRVASRQDEIFNSQQEPPTARQLTSALGSYYRNRAGGGIAAKLVQVHRVKQHHGKFLQLLLSLGAQSTWPGPSLLQSQLLCSTQAAQSLGPPKPKLFVFFFFPQGIKQLLGNKVSSEQVWCTVPKVDFTTGRNTLVSRLEAVSATHGITCQAGEAEL